MRTYSQRVSFPDLALFTERHLTIGGIPTTLTHLASVGWELHASTNHRTHYVRLAFRRRNEESYFSFRIRKPEVGLILCRQTVDNLLGLAAEHEATLRCDPLPLRFEDDSVLLGMLLKNARMRAAFRMKPQVVPRAAAKIAS